MKINNVDIDIQDLIDEKYMHQMINDYVFLSKFQLEVLNKYKINPYDYSSINDLMYIIEEVLEEDSYDDLENVYLEISEYNYYANTNK